MIPAALAPYRRDGERDTVFWFVTLVALAGPLIRSIASHYGAWRTGFCAAFWVTVAATMVVYVVLGAGTTARRQCAGGVAQPSHCGLGRGR